MAHLHANTREDKKLKVPQVTPNHTNQRHTQEPILCQSTSTRTDNNSTRNGRNRQEPNRGTTLETRMMTDWGISIKIEGNKEELIEAIRQGMAIAVSNGSFQNQVGSVAWTIKSATKYNCTVGHGRTLGSEEDQSTY